MAFWLIETRKFEYSKVYLEKVFGYSPKLSIHKISCRVQSLR